MSGPGHVPSHGELRALAALTARRAVERERIRRRREAVRFYLWVVAGAVLLVLAAIFDLSH